MKRVLVLVAFCVSAFSLPHLAAAVLKRWRQLDWRGSTFVNPLMSMVQGIPYSASGLEINYQSIGSAADVNNSSPRLLRSSERCPLTDEQLAQAGGCHCGHIPVIMGRCTYLQFAWFSKQLRFSPATVANSILGRSRCGMTDDRRDNPCLTLPSSPVLVVHRSDGSGTTTSLRISKQRSF